MDIVVMVVSIRNPELRPGLIDRYLIGIQKGGAEPVLCVNKCDLVQSERDYDALEPYRNLGIRTFRVSTKQQIGVSELRAALANRLAVFVGHSGVGKSSLTNALKPDAGAVTGKISAIWNRGKHTTTGSTMYQMADTFTISMRLARLVNLRIARTRMSRFAGCGKRCKMAQFRSRGMKLT